MEKKAVRYTELVKDFSDMPLWYSQIVTGLLTKPLRMGTLINTNALSLVFHL